MTAAERLDTQGQVDAVEAVHTAFTARRLKTSLHAFLEAGWHVIEPGIAFLDNWHLHAICQLLEQVDRGDIDRVIINQPPGTCKTRMLLFWAAHLLARDPRRRIMVVTYGDDLSTKFAGDLRTLMRSTWFQTLFPMRFKRDQDEKAYFSTLVGGWCLATSVGGKGQGLHPDFIIFDDPIKALDAKTAAGRDEVWEFYKNTLTSRGMTRRVRIVASGQRLDVDDFFGRLLASPAATAWVHRRFPMRYEPSRPPTDHEPEGYQADPLDPRTEPGHLLWPTLIPEAQVHLKEQELAEDAVAQFQQRPELVRGRVFKIQELKFYDVAPALMRIVRGWDTGATEGGGDPTVGVKIGEELVERHEHGRITLEPTGRFYVLDVVRAHLGPEGVDKLFVTVATADGSGVAQREEREGGASGKAVTQARAKLLRGVDYAEVPKHTNKMQYSKPFRAHVNAGNVYLPRGAAWVADYVRELQQFPSGEHDDQVDASAIAFNAVLLDPVPDKEWFTL